MNWEQEFKEKTMSLEEAIRQNVRSGDKIYIGSNVAEDLISKIIELAKQGVYSNLSIYGSGPKGNTGLNDPTLTIDMLHYYSNFYMKWDRDISASNGLASYTPVQYGQLDPYYETIHPDVGLFRMTPPDDNGYCNIGPFGYNLTAFRNCRKRIVQISPAIPHIQGIGTDISVNEIDAFVNLPFPMQTVTDPDETKVDQKIAEIIAERIPDGACIQLGIGGIANAIGYRLRDKKHLGIHTEMFTTSMVELIECGAVDNSKKKYMPGVSVVGFIWPTPRVCNFIDHNTDVLFPPFTDVVNADIIALNDNFVSINSAIAVDITGQICAESIGQKQFSGTGGQLDFVRGAVRSKGGKSFITFTSEVQTKNGPKSRIVFNLEPGSIITTPRSEVQYIATEYGCVDLRFQDIPTRVKRMISIAHPKYRDELTFQAKKYGYL